MLLNILKFVLWSLHSSCGVLFSSIMCGHQFYMYTVHCTPSAQNFLGIFFVLIIDWTMSSMVQFFFWQLHSAMMCNVLLSTFELSASHNMSWIHSISTHLPYSILVLEHNIPQTFLTITLNFLKVSKCLWFFFEKVHPIFLKSHQ
jgi:hypothetical protein